MIVRDSRKIFAALAADRIIMDIRKQVDKTSAKIERVQTIKRREPSSKDALHYDPMDGLRMSDDEAGWLIGAVMVVAICAVMVIVHTSDYWGG